MSSELLGYNHYSNNFNVEKVLKSKRNKSKSINDLSSEHYIYLSSFIQLPITDERLYTSILKILDKLHLAPFIRPGTSPIPSQFLKLIKNPIRYENHDINNYHPIVFYLTGLLNVSLSQVVTDLYEHSPIELIFGKIYSIKRTRRVLDDCDKQAMIYKYSAFYQFGGLELMSRLYDLVKGNEEFFVVVLIIITLHSLSQTFTIQGFENFDEECMFENEAKLISNIEDAKVILSAIGKINNQKLTKPKQEGSKSLLSLSETHPPLQQDADSKHPNELIDNYVSGKVEEIESGFEQDYSRVIRTIIEDDSLLYESINQDNSTPLSNQTYPFSNKTGLGNFSNFSSTLSTPALNNNTTLHQPSNLYQSSLLNNLSNLSSGFFGSNNNSLTNLAVKNDLTVPISNSFTSSSIWNNSNIGTSNDSGVNCTWGNITSSSPLVSRIWNNDNMASVGPSPSIQTPLFVRKTFLDNENNEFAKSGKAPLAVNEVETKEQNFEFSNVYNKLEIDIADGFQSVVSTNFQYDSSSTNKSSLLAAGSNERKFSNSTIETDDVNLDTESNLEITSKPDRISKNIISSNDEDKEVTINSDIENLPTLSNIYTNNQPKNITILKRNDIKSKMSSVSDEMYITAEKTNILSRNERKVKDYTNYSKAYENLLEDINRDLNLALEHNYDVPEGFLKENVVSVTERTTTGPSITTTKKQSSKKEKPRHTTISKKDKLKGISISKDRIVVALPVKAEPKLPEPKSSPPKVIGKKQIPETNELKKPLSDQSEIKSELTGDEERVELSSTEDARSSAFMEITRNLEEDIAKLNASKDTASNIKLNFDTKKTKKIRSTESIFDSTEVVEPVKLHEISLSPKVESLTSKECPHKPIGKYSFCQSSQDSTKDIGKARNYEKDKTAESEKTVNGSISNFECIMKELAHDIEKIKKSSRISSDSFTLGSKIPTDPILNSPEVHNPEIVSVIANRFPIMSSTRIERGNNSPISLQSFGDTVDRPLKPNIKKVESIDSEPVDIGEVLTKRKENENDTSVEQQKYRNQKVTTLPYISKLVNTLNPAFDPLGGTISLTGFSEPTDQNDILTIAELLEKKDFPNKVSVVNDPSNVEDILTNINKFVLPEANERNLKENEPECSANTCDELSNQNELSAMNSDPKIAFVSDTDKSLDRKRKPVTDPVSTILQLKSPNNDVSKGDNDCCVSHTGNKAISELSKSASESNKKLNPSNKSNNNSEANRPAANGSSTTSTFRTSTSNAATSSTLNTSKHEGNSSDSDSDFDGSKDQHSGCYDQNKGRYKKAESEEDQSDEGNGFEDYEFDEVDNDEDFKGIVDTLADLFPIYSRSELSIRLKSNNDIDSLIETLFSEQESLQLEHSEITPSVQYVFSPEVQQLKEIFPDLDEDILQLALENNNSDIGLTSNALFEGNIPVKTKKTYSIINNSQAYGKKIQYKSSSISLQNNAKKLQEIFNIPLPQATAYLRKHNDSFVYALIDVVANYIQPTSKKILSESQKSIPRGGRVQGGSGKPVNLINAKVAEPVYILDENSAEAKELKAIYFGNPQFSAMNEKFFEKALIFFKGNVGKVIEIAAIINEHGVGNLTFDSSMVPPSTPPLASLLKSSLKLKNDAISLVPTKNNTRKVKEIAHIDSPNKYKNMREELKWKIGRSPSVAVAGYYKEAANEVSKQYRHALTEEDLLQKHDRLHQFTRTGTLDLHNLTVSTAMNVTKEVLQYWWHEELEARQADGNLTKFGSKVQFVDPLHLITGRGIHSKGGISKIKVTVRNYLNNNNYIFEENSGSLTVIGKKKNSSN